MEQYAFDAINAVRARAGLSPLVLNEQVSKIARDWSAYMASVNAIPHRPQDQLSALLPPNWRSWGENVGTAGSIQEVQKWLERSEGHLANMVNPSYNTVGIGVVVLPSGQLFVTQNFVGY